MATDQNSPHGRRPNFHRGRRGQDRRGNERRGTQPPPEQSGRDGVDVEQIMREIRTRISQRHGIELTTAQIQELAARRLEAILDPRTLKPSLLEQIRRSAATPTDAQPAESEAGYTFDETALYESPRGSLRSIRRLLNPLLKLFFNPTPLIHALSSQVRLNKTAAAREAVRDRRQAEWNALHYDILQRLVTEITRTGIETQNLSMRVEALSAKVDFAERRARNLEGTLHQARPAPRPAEPTSAVMPAAQPVREGAPQEVPGSPPAGAESTSESGRRRRRRRRGRKPQGFSPEGVSAVAGAHAPDVGHGPIAEAQEPSDGDDSDHDDGQDMAEDDGGFATPAPIVAETAASPADVPVQPTAPPDAGEPEPAHTQPAPQNDTAADEIDGPDPSRPSER
jgi:hypothetical protein